MVGDKPKSRPMRFPYTMAAQIAQFPHGHYFKHSWLFRYWLISCIICTPLFYKIEKLSYSEENVKYWDEKRRKEFEGHGH